MRIIQSNPNKAKKKYFPDGITPFDPAVFDTLFKAEDDNERALHDALSALKAARETKDRAVIVETKAQVKALQREKDKIKLDIKTAMAQYSLYYRAAKPYLDAKRTLTQIENYEHLDEITALYADAAARLQAKRESVTV